MTQAQSTNKAENLLPADQSMALKTMIAATQDLINFTEHESQALAKNEMMDFAVMQNEKTLLTERYVQLSKEFRNRLEDFRGADRALLDQLEAVQKSLGENSRHNNKIIDQIQVGARKKTNGVLFNANKLGESHPVHFANNTLLSLNEQQDEATGA